MQNKRNLFLKQKFKPQHITVNQIRPVKHQEIQETFGRQESSKSEILDTIEDNMILSGSKSKQHMHKNDSKGMYSTFS
jgi:hypothetical protein